MKFKTTEIRHMIAGEPSGEPVMERRNPAAPDDRVSLTAVGTEIEAQAAIDAALDAQSDWADTPPPARGQVLSKAAEIITANAERIATDLTREEGKTLAEALGEVRRAADILRFFGGEGWRLGGETFSTMDSGSLVFTRREPLGVIVAITPWNFPIAIPTWKIAPALVSGNAVVLKPASITSLSALHLVDALESSGLPAGVLNVVFGPGASLGRALVDDDRVSAITFTGSTDVGSSIQAATANRRTRIQLEMGGKNPLVVLDDADIDEAARIAASGGFGLTGQACTATSRVIVTPAAKPALLDAMSRLASKYSAGDGLTPDVLMGPVVTGDQLAIDLEYVDVAAGEGGKVLFGGKVDGAQFLQPTVIDGVSAGHRIAREEVFGPVISVIDADDFEGAVEIANDVEYGLSAGICTRDLRMAHEFAERVQAGVVKVNRPTTGLELNVPFGGIKASSTGTYREQGSVAIDFFTRSKSIYIGHS
jgi:alpha-ketoglutaric semialdehyde dehydrogenase